MIRIALLAAILAVAAFPGLPAGPAMAENPSDRVITFDAEDPEMNAAIQKARDRLPLFWQVFRDRPPGTSDFSLKVAIADDNGVEHFWAGDIQLSEGVISAVIANDPVVVKSVVFGQRIEVPEPDISDWMFVRNGKIVGGETLRVMLGRMTPEERAQYQVEFEDP
jgi:uncharacterized protein YegJ (DUF2314 family)